MVSKEIIEACSEKLWQAELTKTPIDVLTASYPDLDERDAYAIAAATLKRRQSQHRAQLVGFKLGYTSPTMRAQMNIARPNYGVLTTDHLLNNQDGQLDNLVPSDELIHPLVEPEISILINRKIEGGNQTRQSILSHIEAIIPSLEVVDTRYKEYKFTLFDNISDNSSASRVVLGTPKKLSQVSDLRLSGVLLWTEGKCVDSGIGANSMGDPLLSIVWLANFLAEKEQSIPAGSVIMTGGLSKAHPAKSGQSFVAEFGGLGVVKAHFS
jgi:2-keto-4-pentenoate hydratase